MIKRHLAGLIVAAVVAGGGVAAAAAPDSGGTGDSTTATSRPNKPNKPPREQVQKCREEHQAGQPPSEECQQLRNKHRKPRPAVALARHTIHGDLIVKDKDGQFRNITLDKGTVESKGDQSITLKREDGRTLTFRVTGDTKFRGVDSLEAVQTGQPAVVLSNGGVAQEIAQRAPGRNNPNGGNVGSDEEQVPAT